MDKQPLVSVFIVTYNSSDYIIEALESVKSQSYQNIELVVSDDCSFDNTVSLVKSWVKDNGERFVRTEVVETAENTGIPANYNRAVKACKGEWLKMMDGDDLIMENCISDNIEYVSDNPEVSVVFSDLYRFTSSSKGSKILGKRFTNERKTFFKLDSTGQLKWLLKGNILPSQTCFIRASLLKENLYNEKYRLLEDYPMWVTLSRKDVRFYYIDKCTAMYRETDSVSSSRKVFFPERYINIRKEFYDDEVLPLIKKYGVKNAYDYNRKYFLWYDACRILLRNKKNGLTTFFYWVFRAVIFKCMYFKL